MSTSRDLREVSRIGATSCSAAREAWARPPSPPPPPTGWPSRGTRCWSSRWTRRPPSPTSSSGTSSARGRWRSCPTSSPRKSTPTSASRQYQERDPPEDPGHVRAATRSPRRSRATSRPRRPSRPWRRAPSSTRWWTSWSGGQYDYYIYDLVPLGHALYYLSMASVYDEWIDKITKLARGDAGVRAGGRAVWSGTKKSEEDEILNELQYIKERINTSSGILTDREKTAFFFVVIPEEMIILDTQKAAAALRQVQRAALRLHRQPGHPAESGRARTSPSTCGTALQMQTGYLTKIDGLSGPRCWPGFPSSSGTSPACR